VLGWCEVRWGLVVLWIMQGTDREDPSSKIQIPKKSQAPNFKTNHQSGSLNEY